MQTNKLKKILNSAKLAQNSGKLVHASRLYEEFLQIMPDYLPVLSNLGTIYVELGNFDKAEKLLKRAAQIDNKNIYILYNLARLYHIKEKYKEAKQLYEKIVKHNPNFGHAWNNLGLIFKALGKLPEAITAFKKATKLLPNYAPSFNNLAVAFEEANHFYEAEKNFKKAIEINNNYIPAKFNLGCLLFRLERFKEAKYYLKEVLTQKQEEPTALFLLKCIEQKEIPQRAPVEYIEKTFDHCADVFEEKLLKELKYQTPKKLFKLFQPYLKENSNILDLGCGTGLGAEFYRPYAKLLYGIDCSSRMLKKAKAKDIFDKLIKADILNPWPIDIEFEYIYSSDCLCYFGELSQLFAIIKKYLVHNGFFGFSVEALKDSGEDFALGTSGRFSHKKEYIIGSLNENKMECIDLQETILRKEQGKPVLGYIVIARSTQ